VAHPPLFAAASVCYMQTGVHLCCKLTVSIHSCSAPYSPQVHLVDVESRELVYALVVAAEAQGPLITRWVLSRCRDEDGTMEVLIVKAPVSLMLGATSLMYHSCWVQDI
jgi:hypothetical protein